MIKALAHPIVISQYMMKSKYSIGVTKRFYTGARVVVVM